MGERETPGGEDIQIRVTWVLRSGFTICTAVHVVTLKNHLELFDFKLK